jgi:ABC-type transport system involved in multi-copper enzyme maturation permease subunit
LLIYKFLGGLTFMFLNSTLAVGGIWLALGLRSGIWAPGFLVTILVITFFFAILYSVSALFAVLTRSVIVCILVTIFVWFVFWVIGTVYAVFDQLRNEPMVKNDIPAWVFQAIDTAHFVTPRTKDLDVLTTRLLSHDVLPEDEQKQMKLDRPTSINWGESLTVSGVFIALMLGLACLRFSRKDY